VPKKERLSDTDYFVYKRLSNREVALKEKNVAKWELWMNPGGGFTADYGIIIGGKDYQFCRDVTSVIKEFGRKIH